ncbi:SDR family oxidoreductase [Thermomonas sp.]|uniref:SDR family oxidoreductase n=1 Tax=Thermomonas sp. TaxID=1971895 RepID=UPI002487E483|nr:SDR family oxidoreductase [Thermomonas sp.]MDI1251580.1 SDR family oxidoreductase [Thermomonas sp.]
MIIAKVFIVTGAARGIGYEVCRQLVGRGHRVVAAVRQEKDIQDIASAIGPHLEAVLCDVSDSVQVRMLVQVAMQQFGRLDGLVNNAGTVHPIGKISEVPATKWKDALLTNVYGPYLCSACAVPYMADAGGVIVNLSSGAANKPMEGWSAYCASKAALAMFTRSMHQEFGARISTVGFAPGLVDTDMQASIRHSGVNPVSKLNRTSLTSPSVPASLIVSLLEGVAHQYSGQEVDARDEAFRKICGHSTMDANQ